VAKPTKDPVATGLVTNRRLFQKLYDQTIPAVTYRPSGCLTVITSYNVLRSTVIAMNNFVQCNYCQAAVA